MSLPLLIKAMSRTAADEAGAPLFRKIGMVHARRLEEAVIIETPEGRMRGQSGDWLLSDDPPTHSWPVRADVFARTYVRAEEPAVSLPPADLALLGPEDAGDPTAGALMYLVGVISGALVILFLQWALR